MKTYKYYGPAPYDGLICPFGCDAVVQGKGTTTTLVGWFGGPDKDPNHWSQSCTCTKCGEKFVKHWVIADHNAWYSQGGYCLAGKPSCCESSLKVHCQCGGWQEHSRSSNGLNITNNVKGHWIPGDPQYWQCTQCKTKYPDYHYGDKFMDEESIEKFREWAENNPKPPPKPIKFKVEEDIGVGVINLSGITTINSE